MNKAKDFCKHLSIKHVRLCIPAAKATVTLVTLISIPFENVLHLNPNFTGNLKRVGISMNVHSSPPCS